MFQRGVLQRLQCGYLPWHGPPEAAGWLSALAPGEPLPSLLSALGVHTTVSDSLFHPPLLPECCFRPFSDMLPQRHCHFGCWTQPYSVEGAMEQAGTVWVQLLLTEASLQPSSASTLTCTPLLFHSLLLFFHFPSPFLSLLHHLSSLPTSSSSLPLLPFSFFSFLLSPHPLFSHFLLPSPSIL